MALDLRNAYPPLDLGRREPYILSRCAGRRVLDLGCVDVGLAEEKAQAGGLLHMWIKEVAAHLVGIDIDPSYRHLLPPASETYDVHFGNVEDPATFDPVRHVDFDVIVAAEIVEHLNNPGLFLWAIRDLMRPHTRLIVTVPNAMRFQLAENVRAGVEMVHPDHNYWFSPTTLQTLLNKNGLHVEHLRGYSSGTETAEQLGPQGLGCPGLIAEGSVCVAGEVPRRWPPDATDRVRAHVTDAAPPPRAAPSSSRPRVLCITDRRGWAYENIFNALRETLETRYELLALPYNEFARVGAEEVRRRAGQADAIYCFSAVMPDGAYDLLSVRPMVAGIHGESQLERYADRLVPAHLARFAAVGCLNDRIAARCRALGLHDRLLVTRNGVDTATFRPATDDPADDGPRPRPIACGWVGWAGHSQGRVKRFDDLVVPACRRAGVPLRAVVSDVRYVPFAEMPAYYRTIDVLLVASTGEGTSGPLLEAGASGCAMCSTRVGSAETLIEDGVNGFLVDPSVEAIAERLLWCREHPGATRAMGRAARETIRAGWTWTRRAEEYAALFDAALGASAPAAPSSPAFFAGS
jgi:glycosyltransferase involved in cell wall biosynthesis/2-polyprenyl-3-methyl-5-hydroxy-6-metoxy-1,4-benzoquinol methylase